MRRLCLAMAVLVIFNLAGIDKIEAAAGQEIDKIPLVLISEPAKDGAANSDGCIWVKSGLVSRLESLGYSLGADLFVCVPDRPYKDLDSGALVINDMLNRVLASSGCSNVQVAAYGVSGLVLRICLEVGLIEDGVVADAIMLTAPQRGSFLAGLLFDMCQVVKHESVFEQSTRQSRFSPFGDVLSTSVGKTISAKNTGELPPAIGSNKFSWEGEAWWVAKRASEIYEPLYAEYVKGRFLSLPYIPIDSPKETFQGWIKRNRPLIWENCIARQEVPPLGPAPVSKLEHTSPERGQDLTTAYYEILAMDVARNQYVMRMASQGSLAKSLFSEAYVPSNWKDALIHYGSKALIHYAKKALVTVKAEVQKLIAGCIVHSAGFLDDSESLFLRRLAKEDVLVNLGTSLGERFYRVKSNYYLASLNEKSSAKASERKTRYVSLTGRVSNLAAIVWPQIAPNNFFCEVDSAIPPQGPRDIVRVFSGILSPSYLDLLKDKRVQESIIDVLPKELEPGEAARPTDGRCKEMSVSSWHPAYIFAPGNLSNSEAFQVSIDVPLPPEGWGYAVWVEGYDGNHWLPVPGGRELLNAGKDVRVILKNQSYRAGIRLERTGIVNPYMPGGKAGSVFEKEITRNVWVALDSFGPGEVTDGNWAGPQLPPNEDSQPSPGLSDEFPETPWDSGGEDIPTVRVVYRNKHTTLKKPEEVYHSYWEVDFGDGEAAVIQGQPDLLISHTFEASGSYFARMVSYDNNGKVLLEKTVKVEVPGQETASCEFRCKSVIPPKVDLRLQGPVRWITGKYALFAGHAAWELPEGAQITKVDCDPGDKFRVLWERSGEFTVLWGVTLTIDYELEGRVIRVKSTYVESMDVDVFTSGIIR